jgi:hypothetical protein
MKHGEPLKDLEYVVQYSMTLLSKYMRSSMRVVDLDGQIASLDLSNCLRD